MNHECQNRTDCKVSIFLLYSVKYLANCLFDFNQLTFFAHICHTVDHVLINEIVLTSFLRIFKNYRS